MIENIEKFTNQLEVAQRLLELLPRRELLERKTLVISSSLNSVILVDEICKNLGLNYEMIFCESIQAPNNNDCDIAMVSERKDVLINENLAKSFGITYDFIYKEADRKYEDILKQIYKFRKGELLKELEGQNILLIDDVCETGMTAMMCVKTLINAKVKTISYAAPFMASDVATTLNGLVDEIYTIDKIDNFIDVNHYYTEKIVASDEIIMSILENSPRYLPLQKQGDTQDAI